MAASLAIVAVGHMAGQTPHTHNAKWRAATLQYMKVQQMNPVGIGGRKAWEPEYLHKN
jgi:hypothetical protein